MLMKTRNQWRFLQRVMVERLQRIGMVIISTFPGSLLLTSVTAQFPGATGLKYRNPETNTLRGVRLQGETMFPPTEEGWGLYTYICVRVKSDSPKKDESRLKRKTDSDVDMYSKNIKVIF